MMILTEEQQQVVDTMAAEPTRAALQGSLTGTGKTLCSIELAKKIGAKTILVIAPLNTFDGWKKTLAKQWPDLPVRVINSNNLQNFERLEDDEPGMYLIGREFFYLAATDGPDKFDDDGELVKYGRRARWDWKQVKPDIAIADEVQFASSRKSLPSKVLRTLKAGYKVAVSATPNGNKFEGLWAVTRWLWPTLVDKSFWRWVAVWAESEYCPFAQKKVTGEKNPGAFSSSLPCYVRLEKDDVPTEVRKVFLDLTPVQKVTYTQMVNDALAWLDDNPLVAEYPMTKFARLRQMALGEVTFNEDDEVDFAPDCASPKIDAMKLIASKHHPDEPILFLTDSAKFARVAAKRLGKGAVSWTGDDSTKTRDEYKERFGEDIRMIVATIPSIAEGIDGLQRVCSTEVWISNSMNNMLNHQAAGRLNRTGQKSDRITSYQLIMSGTDDDKTLSRLIKDAEKNRATLDIKEAV